MDDNNPMMQFKLSPKALLSFKRALKTTVFHVTKKKDGYLITNCMGRQRFMTLWETVLYKLFGVVPRF